MKKLLVVILLLTAINVNAQWVQILIGMENNKILSFYRLTADGFSDTKKMILVK
jgi:hypothetical protein